MLWGKNSWGKKFRGFLFLLVSVAVIFGLLSTRCGTKSEKFGPTGQTGFPNTSTGQTGFPTATTFTSPSDAATKIFGSLSAEPANNIITARSFQGEIITGRAITARIITGRIITARSPKFFYDDYENNLLSGRLKVSSLSEKQSEGFALSCEGIESGECAGGGKVERADCNIDQSKGLLTFQIRLSDCKEIIDQSKGDYIVSTGYAKGYIKVSTKTSSNGFESSIIFAIEDGDLLVREFRVNKESKRVRTKYSGYKNEFIYGFISVDKDVDLRVVSKLSGSYSREDEIGRRKEAYSYYDFASVLTGKFPSSGEYQLDITSLANYLSISGGYSVDTEPSSCAEGVFYYKTIKPIKLGLFEVFSGEGFCGAESGEIEVNNARMEFSSGKVKVSVDNQQREYGCNELGGLCKYEPITIAEELQKGETQPQLSSEAQQALDKISKISPDDSLQDIIAQYKEARKIIAERMQDKGKPPTAEEKYIYFIADSALLIHQLIEATNKTIAAVLSGKLDPQTIIDIINKISQAPPQPRIYPAQTISQEKITNIPYGCDVPGTTGAICAAVNNIILSRLEKNLKILQEIERDNPNLKLEVKRLIIKIQLVFIKYALDFGGEHDIGMVYFFESFLHSIDSIFRLAFSVNFGNLPVITSSALKIPDYLNQITQAGYPPIQDDPILHFGRIITYLLIRDPTLLTLASEIEVARGRYQLIQSLDKTQKFLEHVINKNQNSQKTVFFYDTEKELIKMRYKLNQENKEVELMKKSDFEKFGEKVKLIQNNIEKGGEPVSLSRDIFFVASVLLVGFIKSGIAEPIVDIAINFAGQENTKIIRQFLSSDLFQPSLIASVLAGVFGDVFYLDLGKVFSNLIERKTEYRKWLPAWTTFYPVDKPNILDNFKNNFVVEWDCGEGDKNAKLYDESITQFKREMFGLSCTQPVPQQDPPHFPSSLTYSISLSVAEQNILPADEVFFSFPYILFQDPSFGELVIINKAGIVAISGENSLKISNYLNSCGVQEGKKAYFGSPRSGNCALNAALQNIISGLISKIRR
jgi:hypothetical protein